MKKIKKVIYLFLTGIVVNYKKKMIKKIENRIGKLEIKLVLEKQLYKELLKTTKDYCNTILKIERNM
ncbi:hypothetical protein [Clostridium botulinum]|uniref:hypothetical protein n=1 Tax=Clostridium botulinum TaxID=1491 RepID=UPI00077333B7|nr:hypothetical protein [Clostridium botulinum]NFL39658.1 hypothetical protein [Clostridium botulinum]NFL66496.1 hypothetical protein [Clostridium botulinum]NFN09556.1 hypothetical protein [Clostridium botulinum]NFN26187.1 hypothetical protein [Clostridium botulinum]NFN33118.1 hypothetical protein [Clostridium botulinum]